MILKKLIESQFVLLVPILFQFIFKICSNALTYVLKGKPLKPAPPTWGFSFGLVLFCLFAYLFGLKINMFWQLRIFLHFGFQADRLLCLE